MLYDATILGAEVLGLYQRSRPGEIGLSVAVFGVSGG